MPPTTIAILGAKGGVGTSSVSANLAIYLATIGKRVLAVDADPDPAFMHGSVVPPAEQDQVGETRVPAPGPVGCGEPR